MNKLFIVLLAVCLVSVHAFVKRDAPPKEASDLEKIQEQINEIKNVLEGKVKEAFDPEEIKKGFNTFVDNVQKAIDDLKPKDQPPK